jgi:hypothetical protein
MILSGPEFGNVADSHVIKAIGYSDDEGNKAIVSVVLAAGIALGAGK